MKLSFETRTQTSQLLSVYNQAKAQINNLLNQNSKSKLKLAFAEINKNSGISNLTQNSITVIDNGKKLTLTSEKPHQIRFSQHDVKTNTLEKDVFINNGVKITTKGINENSLDSYLQNICEMFDDSIFRLRKFLINFDIEKLFKPTNKHAKLNPQDMESANNLITLFRNIDKNISSISAPMTRTSIKNGYPTIKTGVCGSKQLAFITPDEKEFRINVIADHKNKTNLVIKITDKDNQITNIIVEPDGKTLKAKKVSRKCIIGEKSEYYTQEELNSPLIKNTFETLKTELENYNQYILTRIEKLNTFKTKFSTSTIGKFSKDTNLKINTIKTIHQRLMAKLAKLKDTERKNAAKNKLKIETVTGKNHAILYKNVGKYQHDIHLSFPTINNKPSMKIVVLGYNNKVKDSYFIQDGKLVKFDAKNASRSKRSDTVFNYHTQEEIESSNLSVYIEELLTKLNNIDKVISKGNGWYR